ncbi:MAG: hypothetical protein R3307_09740, partial [Anaerolineales bacterium]|nr:hypothetical protein [Anaerolineales bacterium]
MEIERRKADDGRRKMDREAARWVAFRNMWGSLRKGKNKNEKVKPASVGETMRKAMCFGTEPEADVCVAGRMRLRIRPGPVLVTQPLTNLGLRHQGKKGLCSNVQSLSCFRTLPIPERTNGIG